MTSSEPKAIPGHPPCPECGKPMDVHKERIKSKFGDFDDVEWRCECGKVIRPYCPLTQ